MATTEKLVAHFRQPTTTPQLVSITMVFNGGVVVNWEPPREDRHQLPDGAELVLRAQNGMLHLILKQSDT